MSIDQVPRYRVRQRIDAGELVVVLPHHPPPPMPISVLHPGSRNPSPRSRIFADWLAALFQRLQSDEHL